MSYLEYEENDTEILKCIIFIDYKYFVIGKTNGILSIFDIINKKYVLTNKINNGSITCLLNYKTKNTDFILCSDEPKIIFLKLIIDYNNQYKLEIINNLVIHESYIKKIEYLGNNNFASCSLDRTFKIWNINEIKLKLEENVGLENFFFYFNNKKFEKLIILNKNSILSFYIYNKGKLLLKEIILNIDYTNSKSMQKIKDKLFIGGYKYFQVISFRTNQIITKIKAENPISFIYNSVKDINNNFIILGLKNGKLEFRAIKKLNKLNDENIVDLEKEKINFKFSNLFQNKEIKLFENKPIISFYIFLDKLICLSDNKIRIYNKFKLEKEKEKEKENDGYFSNLFKKETYYNCAKKFFTFLNQEIKDPNLMNNLLLY